ncbi:ABC-2 type transport system permease protein [Clostridium cavendishii DSM 21758]|uniref:ABC-2 type transport system permease protein n=1 Tax=Clostridium cavendishii DSM 21758 TaxID=1121302 RepID=A0A1M6ITJ2_9CLOT|nr:ABC transporter permease [Clostridium cavendishii]SHJ37800.1 ABC-2 type transport system permease protein [Clostridium cavendishii DSM 21758]
MVELIKCEINKVKTLKSLVLAFIIPLFMTLLGLINIYRGIVETKDLWDAVYNQTLILYSALILPLSITIIIALQWRVEYKHNNIINLCSSPIKLKNIYISKILTTLIIVFINFLILIGLLLIFSKILIPKESFRLYIIYAPLIAFVCSIPFICLQHIFSMSFRNFILSISVGILISFSGFILSHTTIGILNPSTYIVCGSFVGVAKYDILKLSPITFPYTDLLVLVVPILSAILYCIGASIFNGREF